LACPGGVISRIEFASFGTPGGSCGNFTIDNTCNAQDTMSIVSKLCLGKPQCDVLAEDSNFTSSQPSSVISLCSHHHVFLAVFGDPCPNTFKRLYVQVGGCALEPLLQQVVTIPVNSNATVVVPKLDISNITITESGSVVWQNGKFVPGTIYIK